MLVFMKNVLKKLLLLHYLKEIIVCIIFCTYIVYIVIILYM